MNNILFLHTQLSGYFLSSVLYSVEKSDNLVCHIVVSSNTNEAPFEFTTKHERIKLYNRNDYKAIFDFDKLIESVVPSSIITCNWRDKLYLKVARKYKGDIPITIAMDNIWYGQFRQYLGMIYSRLFFVNLFDFIWVPGQPQSYYAGKLGFKNSQIVLNSYCADIPKFKSFYNKSKVVKESNFPHRFLFVGRYVPQKGLSELCEAFKMLQKEQPNDWELVCVGTGPLFESRSECNNIIHKGFVQPENFEEIVSETGVFILPSWEEHWGVVLHEFAVTGYPIISCKDVGAASTFVKEAINGYAFEARNVIDLKNMMLKMVNSSDSDLIEMGRKSIAIGESITQEMWLISLMKIMKKA